jgi:hypothetical protein
MLDHQADLLTRLHDADVRRVWIDQVTENTLYTVKSSAAQRRPGAIVTQPETAKSNGAASIRALLDAAREAEAFHVVPDLTQLVVFAASQLAETDRIDRTLAPTRSGFVRFEGGLPFYDIRGKQLRISWMVWGPVLAQFHSRSTQADVREPEEVTAVWMWNDHRDEPDDIAQNITTVYATHADDINRTFGRWGFIGHEMLIDGTRLGPPMRNISDADREELHAQGEIAHEFSNVGRLIHAFFLLLGQTVTATRTELPDRPRRRRAARAGLPGRVTVVHLRNVEATREPGETLVEWSHRWVVRGFWRWQVCGKDHQLAQEIAPGKWRARMWIAPYVKGPKDKPLVITDKVYAVHR